MELRHLRYFQAVAEELSFSRAARRLRVAQPALSRAIRELEEELDTPLLVRRRRVSRLTPAGAVLLEETGRLLQRMEEAIRRVKRTASGEEGEVRLGYIGPPTRDFLGELMREYSRLHPRVGLVLEERTPERVWEMVAAGRLDLGFTRPVLAAPTLSLKTLSLRKEYMMAALPQGHRLDGKAVTGDTNESLPPLSWKELSSEPLILLSRREGVGMHEMVHAACRRAKFTPRVVRTPSLIDTVLGYVEAGTGVGVIPSSVARFAGDRPLVFRALAPGAEVELVLVWNETNCPAAALGLIDLVREWLEEKKISA